MSTLRDEFLKNANKAVATTRGGYLYTAASNVFMRGGQPVESSDNSSSPTPSGDHTDRLNAGVNSLAIVYEGDQTGTGNWTIDHDYGYGIWIKCDPEDAATNPIWESSDPNICTLEINESNLGMPTMHFYDKGKVTIYLTCDAGETHVDITSNVIPVDHFLLDWNYQDRPDDTIVKNNGRITIKRGQNAFIYPMLTADQEYVDYELTGSYTAKPYESPIYFYGDPNYLTFNDHRGAQEVVITWQHDNYVGRFFVDFEEDDS